MPQAWKGMRKLGGTKFKRAECYNNGKECGNWVKKKIHISRIRYKNETQCENWAQKNELECE